MKVGDVLTLWSRDKDGNEFQEFPQSWEGLGILVKRINSPHPGTFQVDMVQIHDGRSFSTVVYYMDPEKYKRFYGGREMFWKGQTHEYHLDQVLDNEEDLL